MTECLPDLPRYIRQREDGSWHGADDQSGPWRPIPAPQSGLPWKADGPAPATITTADRLALAVCVAVLPGSKPCATGCNACRVSSAAVAHELAVILRERHGGSSQVADWLDGVGRHPGTVQTVQGGLHG
jgi:hypothetical protein